MHWVPQKWCLNKTNPVCMKKARYYFLHTTILNGVSTKPTLYVWKNQDTTFYTPQYQMVSQQNQPCICEKGKILLSTHRNTKWSLNKTNSVCMKKARYYFLHTAILNGVSTKPTLYEWKRQDTTFYPLQYQIVSQQNQPCMNEKGKILLSTLCNTKRSHHKTNPVWMKMASLQVPLLWPCIASCGCTTACDFCSSSLWAATSHSSDIPWNSRWPSYTKSWNMHYRSRKKDNMWHISCFYA